MNFAELFKNNRLDVEKSMRAMWCGETSNESQEAYVRQMDKVIPQLFAPEDVVPVVQCMNSYIPVAKDKEAEAKALVGSLWTAPYSPYDHQYRAWKSLLHGKTEDGKPKSIVVTTGTGSGKTECFMMPLVHDLELQQVSSQIQALFLYPLNALMEDQKERLEELLKNTNLTYTVYNGDLPEDEPKETINDDAAIRLRRRIELITGGKYETWEDTDDKGCTVTHYVLKNRKFAKMLYTRKQVRKTPPNILLTNPTMLEYILLRGADAALRSGAGSGLWVYRAVWVCHALWPAGLCDLRPGRSDLLRHQTAGRNQGLRPSSPGPRRNSGSL